MQQLRRVPPWLVVATLVAVSTAVRGFAASRVDGPWISPDETVYALLGQSLYRHGSLEILGGPTPFYSLVVPVLVGPFLSLSDLELGYALLKPFLAFVMSLAAVPAYLWARSVAGRGWALAAAALTVAMPGLAYSGLVMSEVVFYPVLTLAAWAVARAVAVPTWGRSAVLAAAIALAGADAPAGPGAAAGRLRGRPGRRVRALLAARPPKRAGPRRSRAPARRVARRAGARGEPPSAPTRASPRRRTARGRGALHPLPRRRARPDDGRDPGLRAARARAAPRRAASGPGDARDGRDDAGSRGSPRRPGRVLRVGPRGPARGTRPPLRRAVAARLLCGMARAAGGQPSLEARRLRRRARSALGAPAQDARDVPRAVRRDHARAALEPRARDFGANAHRGRARRRSGAPARLSCSCRGGWRSPASALLGARRRGLRRVDARGDRPGAPGACGFSSGAFPRWVDAAAQADELPRTSTTRAAAGRPSGGALLEPKHPSRRRPRRHAAAGPGAAAPARPAPRRPDRRPRRGRPPSSSYTALGEGSRRPGTADPGPRGPPHSAPRSAAAPPHTHAGAPGESRHLRTSAARSSRSLHGGDVSADADPEGDRRTSSSGGAGRPPRASISAPGSREGLRRPRPSRARARRRKPPARLEDPADRLLGTTRFGFVPRLRRDADPRAARADLRDRRPARATRRGRTRRTGSPPAGCARPGSRCASTRPATSSGAAAPRGCGRARTSTPCRTAAGSTACSASLAGIEAAERLPDAPLAVVAFRAEETGPMGSKRLERAADGVPGAAHRAGAGARARGRAARGRDRDRRPGARRGRLRGTRRPRGDDADGRARRRARRGGAVRPARAGLRARRRGRDGRPRRGRAERRERRARRGSRCPSTRARRPRSSSTSSSRRSASSRARGSSRRR